ncbi:uncharacterized protein LOC112590008 [Harpegnathos saltator]|uniref:uncharacterized protein LOC112590008 n=1 Tax=Harpegnathos saltator TaxID=610380 RepID=UPI000DBEDD65|nr:uncharacterized protein LOC112590008 [Harpegnathos saltator]
MIPPRAHCQRVRPKRRRWIYQDIPRRNRLPPRHVMSKNVRCICTYPRSKEADRKFVVEMLWKVNTQGDKSWLLAECQETRDCVLKYARDIKERCELLLKRYTEESVNRPLTTTSIPDDETPLDLTLSTATESTRLTVELSSEKRWTVLQRGRVAALPTATTTIEPFSYANEASHDLTLFPVVEEGLYEERVAMNTDMDEQKEFRRLQQQQQQQQLDDRTL